MRSMRRDISRCSTHARPNPYPDWGEVGTAENAYVVLPSAKRNSVRRSVVAFSIGGISPAGWRRGPRSNAAVPGRTQACS
jgi:hypothetical protein